MYKMPVIAIFVNLEVTFFGRKGVRCQALKKGVNTGITGAIHTRLKVKVLERFSFECLKTKTKVITLANHKEHRQYSEPIKTRSNYM